MPQLPRRMLESLNNHASGRVPADTSVGHIMMMMTIFAICCEHPHVGLSKVIESHYKVCGLSHM